MPSLSDTHALAHTHTHAHTHADLTSMLSKVLVMPSLSDTHALAHTHAHAHACTHMHQHLREFPPAEGFRVLADGRGVEEATYTPNDKMAKAVPGGAGTGSGKSSLE